MTFAANSAPEPYRTTISELEAEIERLRAALVFYARSLAYKGANQKNEGQDKPFTPDADPYVLSIERDCGETARKALSAAQQTGERDDRG